MKAVILAGGLGTRLSEETVTRPKPLVEIGGRPILWHIMKIYSAHGVNEFVICCGYKGYMIKEYFSNYALHMSDVTFDMRKRGAMRIHQSQVEDWQVTLVDTGEDSMTGGRLARVQEHVQDEPFFHFAYGDCLSDVSIGDVTEFHRQHRKLATITAVHPPGRYGALQLNGNAVESFTEKPLGDGQMINGGFFVLAPDVITRYIGNNDACVWEQQPLEGLAADGELMAWKHSGYWLAMDTLREKNQLASLWSTGKAPWKKW